MEYVNAYSIQFFKNNFVYKFFNTVFGKIKLINNFVDRDIVSVNIKDKISFALLDKIKVTKIYIIT
jgi:hypothetical protein